MTFLGSGLTRGTTFGGSGHIRGETTVNSIITHMYIYLLVSVLGFIFYSLGLGLIGGGFFDTER